MERVNFKILLRGSYVLLFIMVAQSLIGLIYPEGYRDVGFVSETWFGNDLITLVIASPLFILSLLLENKKSTLGRLIWLGSIGYAIYNYAFYLFGAALNIFFPLYLLAFILSVVLLILLLSNTDIQEIYASFNKKTPVKLIGVSYALIGVGLSAIWLVMWASYIIGGKELAVAPEIFQVVAVLDIIIMVPALLFGGILVFLRKPWGYVISAIAGIQGSLYLSILGLNAIILVSKNVVKSPGEIPMWIPLSCFSIIITFLLLMGLKSKKSKINVNSVVEHS